MSPLYLGCIADDFTGATDLANNLVRSGMRVVQTMGIPDAPLTEVVDAVVIALKSRTIPAKEAVAQSVQALQWLRSQGAKQIYFKYCSTFDSTAKGNIGPVSDALMTALGIDFTIACPAFPENGRSIYKGYLFTGDVLLQESGMKDHPLTPMTDSNLVRVLQAQTSRRVGLLDHSHVRKGTEAVRKRLDELHAEGFEIVIVDAIDNQDLMNIGSALAELKLITAGSGIAIGLSGNFGVNTGNLASSLPMARGGRAIVSGSCSVATNGQVADFKERGGSAFAIDPIRIVNGDDVVAEALAWARKHQNAGPILVYATASPDAVRQVQSRLGVEQAGYIVENALSTIACGLISLGVGQLVVAGGETSGACVQALKIGHMRIGPQIAPGVPWCHAQSPYAPPEGIHLALKSGNFGSTDFFTKAFEILN